MTLHLQPLSSSMQPVVDAIGFDAALRLVAVFGGTRVLLSTARPAHLDPVAIILGHEPALRLARELGPGLLDVPRCLSWMLARRNEEIVARAMAGETQASLATRFNLTERHIRRLLDASSAAQVPSARNSHSLHPEGLTP